MPIKLPILFLLLSLSAASSATAELTYSVHETEAGTKFVIVSGEFEFFDNLAEFGEVILRDRPSIVGFDSSGGNVAKAMELGRMIRSAGLSTVQVRKAECASACSLAFLGCSRRFAEPGSIGVHKSSFSDTSGMHVEMAVSAVQQTTAEIIGYISEMGVDPGLLQLSLSYDSNDIRYLSGSEMARFKVTTSEFETWLATVDTPAARPAITVAPSGVQAKAEPSLDIPLARDGSVRHPKGRAPLKAKGDGDARVLDEVANGTAVRILEVRGEWYRVSAAGRNGYMHYSWVHVAQFELDAGGKRYVQVKSFKTLPEAEAFVEGSRIPLTAHLAANGWFAVTLPDVYEEEEAKDLSSALKERGLIAKDSMVTIGNTYVRKVCCD